MSWTHIILDFEIEDQNETDEIIADLDKCMDNGIHMTEKVGNKIRAHVYPRAHNPLIRSPEFVLFGITFKKFYPPSSAPPV
jgi:hypothetical protein